MTCTALPVRPSIIAVIEGKSLPLRCSSIARIGGTVTDPKVALRKEDVSRFVAQYAIGSDSKLGKKIDETLGQGTTDLLRDVLGGGKK